MRAIRITCVVPVIEKWPFASDWFTITIEDEATGERAPFPSYTTAAFTELKVEVTSPAGATISSERRGGTSYYHRCETEKYGGVRDLPGRRTTRRTGTPTTGASDSAFGRPNPSGGSTSCRCG